MSLAARCPHCHTVFRISGPQLAAAQGWVRCGGCTQVFDASSNLVTTSGQALQIPTVDTRATAWVDEDAVQSSPAPRDALDAAAAPAPGPLQAMPDIDLELPDLSAMKAEAELERTQMLAAQQPQPPSTPAAQPVVDTLEPARPRGPQPLPDEADTSAPGAPAAQRGTADPAAEKAREPYWGEQPSAAASIDLRGAMAATGAGTVAAAAEVTPAAAGGGALRWLGVLALCLSLLCLVAYALRGHIAQASPEARALVMQACQTLGCRLPPMRQLQAIAVQGSSLSLDDSSGHHRLRLQLHNTSDGPVFMPAIDFSLIDGNGQILARRMLDPVEFDAAPTLLDEGAEIDIGISLDLRTLDAATIASFRVVPFYP